MPDGRTLTDAVATSSLQRDWGRRTLVFGGGRALLARSQSLLRSVLLSMEHVLDEHRVFLWVALIYTLLGGLIQLVLMRPWPIQVTNRWSLYVWGGLSLAWLAWQWVRHPKRLACCLTPSRLGGALLIFTVALPIQITFQSLKQSIGPTIGFGWDPWLSAADQALHGGPAWHWFAPIVQSGRAVTALDVIYKLWFIALGGFLLWACWSKRRSLRSRAILSFLLLWVLGGTIAAALFASAGPCFYHHVTGSDPAYSELVTTLRSHGPLWATFSQDWLWTLRQNDGWQHFGGISAFPSMHVGFTVLLALVAWSTHRGVAALLWLFALLTQIGSVALGWHYAVDGYGGALIAWGCWVLAGRIAGDEHGRAGQDLVAG